MIEILQELYEWDIKEDLSSPDHYGSYKKVSKEILHLIYDIFANVDEVPRISSGYRTEEYNIKVGGVNGSAHTKGLAVDFRITNNKQRYQVLEIAYMRKIQRIGEARTFIHIDIDLTRPFPRKWTY